MALLRPLVKDLSHHKQISIMPEAVPISSKPIEESLQTSLKLLRHLNPSEIEKNVELLGEAVPELKEALKGFVDFPSRVIVASGANNREFLACELSKRQKDDKFVYRCPFDDKFYSLEGECDSEIESFKPSAALKGLEKALNEAVRTYANLYYGSDSITSVFVESNEGSEGFLVGILLKKAAEFVDEENGATSQASWDSIHLFEVLNGENEKESQYRETSTILLSFDNSVENLKNILLNGNLIRQNEFKGPEEKHVVNIGSALEDMESRLRNDLQSVYFGRTHDIVNEMRKAMPEGFLRNQNDFREEMMARLSKK